jgi:lysophospholipase L1-like esterase
MGDSCTGQGPPPYPGYLHALLQARPPDDHRWEAFNTAVHGYTILHGLTLFRKRVRFWQPDVVTILFGWNEHLIVDEARAAELARARPALETAVGNAVVQKRLYTAFTTAFPKPTPPASRGRGLAVPPEAYVEALRTFIREIRSAGAEPFVLTSPRDRIVHRQIVRRGKARSVEEVMALHDEYVRLTRAVARQENARIVDLAAAFAGDAARGMFSSDGIHFTPAGLERVAAEIDAAIRAAHPTD